MNERSDAGAPTGPRRNLRIRLGAAAIALGTLVQIATLYALGTEAFLAFIVVGAGLVGVGMLLAVPAVLARR